jgi:hypothetical protein
MAPVGLAVRCGACRGGGWLRGWFNRCRHCRGRGWFDATTAPGGLGPLVAASEAVRSGAATNLLVRPALPWERFPVPPELRVEGGPDAALWERAVRASAVILYEHADGTPGLAGGLELARLAETHAVVRELFWDTLPGGGRWRCLDRDLQEFHLRLLFFRAWHGEWLEVTVDRPEAPPPPPSSGPAEITGAAQKYITGKMFVGVPKEDK